MYLSTDDCFKAGGFVIQPVFYMGIGEHYVRIVVDYQALACLPRAIGWESGLVSHKMYVISPTACLP